jgi:hypothetical protein
MRKPFTKAGPGRPKGLPNKVTQEARLLIKDCINEITPEILKIFRKMKPHQKTQFYLQLIKYAVPEMKSVDVTTFGESLNQPAKEEFTVEQLRAMKMAAQNIPNGISQG